jgi:hypothetical protein
MRCFSGTSHKSFDRLKGECNECGGGDLVMPCPKCDQLFSVTHVSEHERRCAPKKNKKKKKRMAVRFAYVASEWELNPACTIDNDEDPFLQAPKGQYWLPEGFNVPHSLLRRVYRVQDPTMRGMEWMDVYDAIFAAVASDDDEAFTLVHVFRSWKEFDDELNSKTLVRRRCDEGKLDLVVCTDWLFSVVNSCHHRANLPERVNKYAEQLRDFESQSGCRIFPPIDYTLYFARKEVYYRDLRLVCPVIPTLFAKPDDSNKKDWSLMVKKFAKEHDAERLVLKRTFSGYKRHHHVVVNVADSSGGNVPVSSGGGRSCVWLVQPYVDEFDTSKELRLVVVNGKFLFGIETKFEDPKSTVPCIFPLNAEKHKAAIALAERVASVVSDKFSPGAAHFLRVDLICLVGGTWCVNELEYFGDANIRLEHVDGGGCDAAFSILVEQVKCWMEDVVT